jgi:hypothetical protein
MIEIDQTLISRDILEIKFACDLSKCKGICCVLGDSGAPLEEAEVAEIEKSYPVFQQFMKKEGIEAVEQQGKWVIDSDGDIVTPLINNEECAFVYFENEIAFCAIEKAWSQGLISFHKPISCHLYPVRLKNLKYYTGVNYHFWDVCNSALKNGKESDIQLFKFLKEPLERRFGEEWYRQLLEASEWLNENGQEEQNL